MEGIYGKEQVLTAYLVIICLASIVDMLGSIFGEGMSHNEKTAVKDSKEHKLRQRIKIVFGMVIMLVALAFMLKYCFIVFMFMAFLMFLIVTPCVIGDFVRYIFGKEYGYEMTPRTEKVILLCGSFAWFVCVAIADEKTINEILHRFYSTKFLEDLLKAALLNMWYFSVVFFSVTCLLILIHKIYILWKQKENKKGKKAKKTQLNRREISAEYKWLKRIENTIDILSKYKKFKRIMLYILWLFVLVIESLKVFLAVTISYCCDLITIIVYLVKNMCCKIMGYLKQSIVTNYGQNILFVSRIAFVFSIGVVYLLDQYQGILSESGSSVYEFICSVIIIPFLITQLSELGKVWNKK